MMVLWLASTVFAAEITVGEPTDTRRYKIEAFGYASSPGKRYNLDWRPVDMHYWSGLVECKRTGKRTDTCTFVDGLIEFGMAVRGEDSIRTTKVVAPEGMDVTWSKLGKVKLDLTGDMDNFHKSAADSLLGRYHKPESVYWTPDQWREIGGEMADEFRYWFGGALEAQLPRDKVGEKGWKGDAPLVAQTWSSSTVGGGSDMRIAGQDGNVAFFVGDGRIAEQHFSYSDHQAKGSFTVQTAWDVARGVPVANRIHIVYDVHMAGYYTKRMVLMTEANDSHSYKGGELAGSPIRPE